MLAGSVFAGAVSLASAGDKPQPSPSGIAALVLKSKTDKMKERTAASVREHADTSLGWACSGDKRNGWIVNSLTVRAMEAAGKIKWDYTGLAGDFLFGNQISDSVLQHHMPYTFASLKTLQATIKAELKIHPELAESIKSRIETIEGKLKVEGLLQVVDLACANQPLLKNIVARSADGIDFARIAKEIEAARAVLHLDTKGEPLPAP
jgi:hypothetical protein